MQTPEQHFLDGMNKVELKFALAWCHVVSCVTEGETREIVFKPRNIFSFNLCTHALTSAAWPLM